jgi:PST family polysaccharide transporter
MALPEPIEREPGSPVPADSPGSSGLEAGVSEFYRPLLGGIAWTAGAKWVTQVLTWAATFVVARLLSPSDFGLVGMATVYLGVITLLSEFGLGAAVITLRTMTDDLIAQLNGLSLLFGIGAFAVSAVAARPLGWFFKSPELPAVVLAMSTAFLMTAFKTVPYSLLQRDMQFRRLAIIDACQAVSQSISALTMAWLGLRYWALVSAALIGTAITVTLLLFARPHRFAWPRYRALRAALGFSRDVIVSRLAWYGYATADCVIAGRRLGEAALGAYNLAFTFASIPVERLTDLVTRVTTSVFSSVQEDHAALRRYLGTLTEGISLVTFPAAFGLALVSREFVTLALGKKWESAIVPLTLLALYASLRSIMTLPPQVLLVVKDSGFVMWYNLVALLVFPPVFWVGSRWGISGIALGWVIGFPFIAAVLCWRTMTKIDMPLAVYLERLKPAFNGSAAMAAGVLLVKWFLPASAPLYGRFACEVATGFLTYFLTLWVLHRDRLLGLVLLIKSVRGTTTPLPLDAAKG